LECWLLFGKRAVLAIVVGHPLRSDLIFLLLAHIGVLVTADIAAWMRRTSVAAKQAEL
jgi:hypothetical protein